MSVKVQVYGDCFPNRNLVSDVFLPQLLYFDNTFIGDNAVEHRDVAVTWKGISVAHAKEIDFWEQAFKSALESVIEDKLIEEFMEVEKSASKPHTNAYRYDILSVADQI